MSNSKKFDVTRRSFILGGTAAFVGAGLALSGCNHQQSGQSSGSGSPITGSLAYSSTVMTPIANTTACGNACHWHVFEGLYNIDFHTFKAFNGLAALAPQKIDDYTYDIPLRNDAKFSDGNPVISADVVASFEANMKDTYFTSILNFIKSVYAKDDKTVTFTLNYPFDSLLVERLALVKVFPKSLTQEQLKTMPIGSGPWAFKNIDGNDGGKIDFVVNEHYNGKYPANTNTMYFNIMMDDSSRTTALMEKSVKAIEAVPYDNSEQLRNSGATVEYVQSLGMANFLFNTKKAPFNDKRVRQAFFKAVDTQKLIENQLAGHAAEATCILPKNHKNYHRASTQLTYDKEAAKKLLAEAGVSNLKCTLLVNAFWSKVLAPQIKNDLAEIGVDCELDVQNIKWDKFVESDQILPFDVMLVPADPSIFGDDPDMVMSLYYGDTTYTRGQTCWKSGDYAKWKQLNDLLQQARQTSGTSQQSLWNQCYDILAEECSFYPLLHREVATGYLSDQLANFRAISATGLYFLGTSTT